MGKVESHDIFVDELTRLLDMGTEYLTQRRLKEMRRGMVAFDLVTALDIDFSRNGLADR